MMAAKPIEKTLEKIQAEHKERYRVVDSMVKVNEKRSQEALEMQRAYEKSIDDPIAQKEAKEN